MKRIRSVCCVLIAAVMFLACTGCARQRPRELLISSVVFPDGMHCMHIYRNNRGATVDWSTTITIQNTETAAEKNIFFHYHEQEPDEAVWVSNDTVRINGMKLNICNDYYESFDPK